MKLKTAVDLTADERRWMQINEIKHFQFKKGFTQRVNDMGSGIFLHLLYLRPSALPSMGIVFFAYHTIHE
jgi:hypothetical protein